MRPLCLALILALGCDVVPRDDEGDADVALSGDAQLAVRDTVVVLAAGDVAACTPGASQTARILDSIPGTVLIPGDAAYWSRQYPRPYRTCFDTTWGRHRTRIRPVPGNHDGDVDGMRRYFEYFGDAAGPQPGGYYSFDLGAWHVIALNSNISLDAESPQGRWAAEDLARHSKPCTLALMHHPPFSSGPHEQSPQAAEIWPVLVRAGVDVLMTGHDHIYERLAPAGTNGRRDPRGVRTFVVGTGGNGLYGYGRIHPSSEYRQNRVYGVLKLTLAPASYRWEFVPVRGAALDRGSGRCRVPAQAPSR